MALPISPDRRRSEQRQRAEDQVILLAVEPAIVVTGRLVNTSSSGFCVQHAYPGFTPGQALHLCQAGCDIQVRVMWVRYHPDYVECGLLQQETYLIQRLKAGEGEWFSELLAPYMSSLRFTVNSILHNHADAEEVLQESLLKVIAHLDQFHLGQSFRAWLLQIATNEACKHLRKNRRHRQNTAAPDDEQEQ